MSFERMLSAMLVGGGLALSAPAVAFSPSLHQLTDNGGSNDQSGSLSLIVGAGSFFGFYIESLDSCCGAAEVTVLADFTEPFALPSWILNQGGGDGSVDFVAGTSFHLVGANINGGVPGFPGHLTTYSIGTNVDPPFSFDWRYHTDDIGGPQRDRFGYFCTDCTIVTEAAEPASLALLGLGAGLIAWRRRQSA